MTSRPGAGLMRRDDASCSIPTSPANPSPCPGALPPHVDAAVMAAVADLDDRFARVGITVLRHTGLRIGELLDLELDHLVDYGPNGSWLRVPLGKLKDERSVPVDDTALEVLEEWLAHRPGQRARPHPRDGHLVDFVFVERGRRLGSTRIAAVCWPPTTGCRPRPTGACWRSSRPATRVARWRCPTWLISRRSGPGQAELSSVAPTSSRRRCLSRLKMTRWWRAVSDLQPRVSASSRRCRMSTSWA